MKIKKIELKNWGRHESATWNTDATVVGLSGVNGAGKSTVLKALEFALTGQAGDTEENLASFVRATSEEKPPKSASVTVEIQKDGVDGVIERSVVRSGSSKRKMVWDGKEYTAADEVDAILSDLLGASKKAIKNIVFIPQGKLDEVLFGSQAEQEKMFLKLLLLDHMDDVSKQAERQLGVVTSGMQDHSVALDEVMGMRKISDAQFAELQQKLAATPDWSVPISNIKNLERLEYNKSQQTARVISARNETIAAEEAFAEVMRLPLPDNFLTGLATHPEAECLRSGDLAAIKECLTAWEKENANLNGLWAALMQYNNSTQRLSQCEQTFDSKFLAFQSLPTPEPDASQKLQARMDELTAQIQRSNQYENLGQALERTAAILKKIQERQVELKQLRDTAKSEYDTEGVELQTKLNALTQDISRVESRRDLVVQAEHTHEAGHCPLCLQDTSNVQWETADELHKQYNLLVMEKHEKTDKWNALLKRYHTTEANLQACDKEFENAKQEQAQLNTQLTQFQKPEKSKEALQQEVAEITVEKNNLEKQAAEWAKLKGEVKSAEETFTHAQKQTAKDKATVDAAAQNLTTKVEMTVQSVETARTSLGILIPIASSVVTKVSRAEDRVTSANKTYTAEQEALEPIKAAIAEHQKLCSACERTAALLEKHKDNFVGAQQEAEIAQQARQTIEGELNGVKVQSQKLLDRQRDIEKKIEDNVVRETLAAELKQIRDMFGRKGLPTTYCKSKFKSLAALTAQYLAELESNFIVEPDPDGHLQFRFKRIDEENAAWLPQSKLSGGQRVRLSIAFLLSVQRLVTPELGFLVLDEPSTHLDDDSAEQVAELLHTLATKLQDSEFQIVCCDHHTALKNAYEKTINLN